MRHFGEALGEEAEFNQFERLPDDVLLHIFDKVSDIKWLCRCYMVSKRFSSLIPLVQTVSIKVYKKKNPQGNNGFRGKFSKFLINKVLKPLRYFHKLALSPPSQLNVPPCHAFLGSLKQIRCLDVESVSDSNVISDSVLQWGAQFNTKQASVTFLIAASLSKIKEPEEESEEEELGRRFYYSKMWVGMWLRALSYVLPRHPMLQSISISHSIKGVAKRCLGGEKLVEFRNALTLADPSCLKWDMRVGYVPVLQLPMSGYMMKRAAIFNFKLYGGDDYDANSAVLDAFAEEEGVFLEAVERILEHHRDGIKLRTRTQN